MTHKNEDSSRCTGENATILQNNRLPFGKIPPFGWEIRLDLVLLALTCCLWQFLQQRRRLGCGVSSRLLASLDALSVLKRRKSYQSKSGSSEAWRRKVEFLEQYGEDYGYAKSDMGHIDTWRSREFPTLISPLQHETPRKERPDAATDPPEVYLDYAGAALASQSQRREMLSNVDGVLANPHSTGPAAFRTLRQMEESKRLVLEHFGCLSSQHPGYDLIFTSGATASLRLLAERFPWHAHHQSTLVYSHNAHTSLVGMRQLVPGRRFVCQHAKHVCDATSLQFHQWATSHPSSEVMSNNPTSPTAETEDEEEVISHLLALPLECNFSGERLDVHSAIAASRKAGAADKSTDGDSSQRKKHHRRRHQWYTLLDIAKAAATSRISLCDLNPDFAVVSFYKLFGLPTGLGALFVKNTTAPLLELTRETHNSHYLGGGAVDIVLPRTDVMYPRSSTPMASMTAGTPHFEGIVSLQHGFRQMDKLGGMDKILRHCQCLATELVRRLKGLHHGNGLPTVVIYGPWNKMPHTEQSDATSATKEDETAWLYPGPTVAFNVLRHDGSHVGYNEVSKLAGLWDTPLQLRTGCFCNAGACHEALGLKDEEVLHNFEVGGHVCGDHVDILNDRPTGAVRASFGKDSLWEDLDALVGFLERTFVTAETTTSPDPDPNHVTTDSTTNSWFLSELYVFPIKSCAAQRVDEWKIHTSTGRLEYDREFALVTADGSAMRLQSYPKMGLVRPRIEGQRMIVSAPQQSDLILSLSQDEMVKHTSSEQCERQFRVCGNTCGGRLWGGHRASAWFSGFLGVHCWLVRYTSSSHSKAMAVADNATAIHRRADLAYVNESPLLLVTQTSVDVLNQVLRTSGRPLVTPRQFRPNMVVATSSPIRVVEKSTFNGQQCRSRSLESEEDWWSSLVVEGRNLVFRVEGGCARCSMIDVDPTTTVKGSALRALADYRRRKGQIYFGIFLSCDDRALLSLPPTDEYVTLKQGDCIVPNEGQTLSK